MYLPLGLVVSDEDFLILDDGEADIINEKTQFEKPTSKATAVSYTHLTLPTKRIV